MDNKGNTFNSLDVQDKRIAPSGILPKNMQTRVLSGVAVVMVAVIVLADIRSPKPVSPQLPNAETIDPSTARIQEYQKRVEDQTRKLQLEQAALPKHAQERGMSANAPPTPAPTTRGSVVTSKVITTESPEQIRVLTDRERRDEASLFASNIALSYRNPKVTSEETNAMPGREVGRQSESPAVEITKKQRREMQDTQPPSQEKTEYRLLEGTVLETVLTNRLDGAFSGPVNCMVTANIYSLDGQHLLIPQGSRVLGEVHKVDSVGQQRLAVAFHRLILPNGYSLNLNQFEGLNQIGETGLRDQVNRHYLQVFGISLAIGAIAGLGEARVGTTTPWTGTAAYEQGVASSLSQSSMRILERYLNVVPTFTIREGHRVKIYLSGDLMLPTYDGDQIFR